MNDIPFSIQYNIKSPISIPSFNFPVTNHARSERHIPNPMASTEMAQPNILGLSSDVTLEPGPVNKEDSEAIQYPQGMVLVLIVIALVMSNFLVALDLV